MSLEPGHKLAHYEILEPIGRGGMGEVYRAKDSKLGRDVAIKVLPDEFAQHEERLRRFQREAKVLASLNHPNIAAIHGLEQSGDTHYLVLELVPGETLAERVSRGSIPVREAIDIARKIAAALDHAHEQGVVHRDLKPANIKITPEDEVKVLDFGLAKAFLDEAPDAGVGDTSMSPTITREKTRAGVILGTAAYMAPEQAKGRRVDKRADIWAFGVVVYEMLTGSRPFRGEDLSETLAYVLTKEPDWSALPSDLSATLRRYVIRCLEKDPKRRIRDVGDVRLAMDGAFDVELPSAPRVGASRTTSLFVALSLAAIAVALATWRRNESGTPKQLGAVRFTVPVNGLTVGVSGSQRLSISADGTHLVFVQNAADLGLNQLSLRALDRLETVPMRETLDSYQHAISRDGRWVAFTKRNSLTLMKAATDGGPSITLAELPGPVSGMSWGLADGRILVAIEGAGFFLVPDDGGEVEPVPAAHADGDIEQLRNPAAIPGRRAILFSTGLGNYQELAAMDLDTGETKRLGIEGTGPHYIERGQLVYWNDFVLSAVAFDPERLEVTGGPVDVLEGVDEFSLSEGGRLVYIPAANRSAGTTLVWVDRSGRETPFDPPVPAAGYRYPRLSPDGRRLAFADERSIEDVDLWVVDLGRGARSRVTFGGSFEFFPSWTPDGARITVADDGGLVNRMVTVTADGSGSMATILDRSERQFPTSWAPDGHTLAFYTDSPLGTGRDLWTLTLDREGNPAEPAPFLATPFHERAPAFSPDGQWLAYVSNKSGRDEIYVRRFTTGSATTSREQTISTGGGREPVWSGDGDELFYRTGTALMSVAITVSRDGELIAGIPELLFEGYEPNPFPQSAVANYDVAPDGDRFVMIKQPRDVASSGGSEIVVVLNWFEELERLVPTNN